MSFRAVTSVTIRAAVAAMPTRVAADSAVRGYISKDDWGVYSGDVSEHKEKVKEEFGHRLWAGACNLTTADQQRLSGQRVGELKDVYRPEGVDAKKIPKTAMQRTDADFRGSL